MTRLQKRLAYAILIGMFIVLMPLFALNWMFEEFEAEDVSSIAHHFEAKSVLGVFAHPDDEQLVTGFLIRSSQDPNIKSAVVTATKGEAGTPMPQISRIKDLGAVRKAEALKNTWALGVDHHAVLDFPDGGVKDVAPEVLSGAVRDHFLAHKPDMVVTFWPLSGFSDHPDHKRMGLISERVTLELKANPVDGYSGPDHIAYILAPTKMMNRFAGETGKRVVTNQPRPTHAMPGEAWAKLRGWKIHASQRDYVWHAYKMPPGLVHRLYDKEHYYVLDAEEIPSR